MWSDCGLGLWEEVCIYLYYKKLINFLYLWSCSFHSPRILSSIHSNPLCDYSTRAANISDDMDHDPSVVIRESSVLVREPFVAAV